MEQAAPENNVSFHIFFSGVLLLSLGRAFFSNQSYAFLGLVYLTVVVGRYCCAFCHPLNRYRYSKFCCISSYSAGVMTDQPLTFHRCGELCRCLHNPHDLRSIRITSHMAMVLTTMTTTTTVGYHVLLFGQAKRMVDSKL